MAKWVAEASHLLEPLVEALRRYVLAADKLHGDDTPVPVLAPGNGKTKTGRLWTYVAMTVPQVRSQLRRCGSPSPQVRSQLRRCGSPTRQTARESIRNGT